MMNKEEINDKLNYIDDELVKLQNAKAMKYLCNVEAYIDNLQQRIDKAIEITNKLLMNSAENRLIAKEEEMDYFDWLDRTLEEQLEILGGKE
ncbi:MAG: hypothetical protein IKL65_00195 [Bacilli bacterium]|nr:hypothetical protein [Bacilli bacterium]